MVRWANTNSPPTVTMKSRSPKCTCALGTQLIVWLAIRGLIWNVQRPLPGAPTVGVSNKHQLVNLYCCALGSDGVLKDTRFILVRAECPYIQFATARVISTKKRFVVGGINGRERERSQVSDEMVERTPRAWSLLGCMCDVLCVELISPSWGVLPSLL